MPASFQLHRTYPTEVIWKNRHLAINFYAKEFHFSREKEISFICLTNCCIFLITKIGVGTLIANVITKTLLYISVELHIFAKLASFKNIQNLFMKLRKNIIVDEGFLPANLQHHHLR